MDQAAELRHQQQELEKAAAVELAEVPGMVEGEQELMPPGIRQARERLDD